MSTERLFSVTSARRDGCIVVTAAGEIDLSTSPQLREALRRAESQARAVVLDLREVTFMDSSGLAVVAGEDRRARDEGFRFAVATEGATSVQRILELSGLTSVLQIVGSPDEVLRG